MEAGLTPQKDRQPKRQVSTRGGVGMAPTQGKGSQRHLALGPDPARTGRQPSVRCPHVGVRAWLPLGQGKSSPAPPDAQA